MNLNAGQLNARGLSAFNAEPVLMFVFHCIPLPLPPGYVPSKQNLPFLPKTPACLKIGHLAKVIARNGRVVVGQVRYVGPICNAEYVAKLDGVAHDTFIGLELASSGGDSDGTIEGKRFFYW